MALPHVVTIGPYAAASANNVALAQTPASGAALALNGALVSGGVATLDTLRRILVTYGNETNARTLVLTGTTWAGDAATETVAIPSGGAGAVSSVLDYATVTSAVSGGGAWSNNVTLGTTDGTTTKPVGSSQWVRFDDFGFGPTEIGIDVTGTINYTVESSDDDPNLLFPQIPVAPANMQWIADGALVNVAIKNNQQWSAPPLWTRVTCNSYTTTGNARGNFRQLGGKFG